MADPARPPMVGYMAAAAGQVFPLVVCESRAGFYLGTRDADGAPFSRESVEYWPTAGAAADALQARAWTQRLVP